MHSEGVVGDNLLFCMGRGGTATEMLMDFPTDLSNKITSIAESIPRHVRYVILLEILKATEFGNIIAMICVACLA